MAKLILLLVISAMCVMVSTAGNRKNRPPMFGCPSSTPSTPSQSAPPTVLKPQPVVYQKPPVMQPPMVQPVVVQQPPVLVQQPPPAVLVQPEPPVIQPAPVIYAPPKSSSSSGSHSAEKIGLAALTGILTDIAAEELATEVHSHENPVTEIVNTLTGDSKSSSSSKEPTPKSASSENSDATEVVENNAVPDSDSTQNVIPEISSPIIENGQDSGPGSNSASSDHSDTPQDNSVNEIPEAEQVNIEPETQPETQPDPEPDYQSADYQIDTQSDYQSDLSISKRGSGFISILKLPFCTTPDFGSVCVNFDQCYGNCAMTKEACDKKFVDEMTKHCDQLESNKKCCSRTVKANEASIKTLGKHYFKSARKAQGCPVKKH